ncbi:MAG: GAF domain-containing protein [Candidatus Rokubacteria bacterium]|nr:GAF domain-containing protein [Candidatus Rokubacteria bacterium]
MGEPEKGILYWGGPGIAHPSQLYPDEPEIHCAALGEDGSLPAKLPPLQEAIILAEWSRLHSNVSLIDRWRQAVDQLAVFVLVERAKLGEAIFYLAAREVDDIIETPLDFEVMRRRLRSTFRHLAARREAKRLTRELADQTFDFNEFNRVAVALSAERDVNRLLEVILTKCRELTMADAGSLYLVEGKEPDPGQWDVSGDVKVLRFVIAQNDSKALDLKQAVLPLDRSSIAGYVALTRTPLNIRDVYDLPPGTGLSFNPAMDQKLGYRTKSMLVIPMVDHTDEVIGVVQVINRKRSREILLDTPERAEAEVLPFGLRDQEMVGSLASLAAVALNKAILITRIERLLEGIVRASVTAIEQRDPVTAGHSDRVARLTVGLAEVVDRTDRGEYRHVRFAPEELRELQYASLLHDVGKVGVREHVLIKGKKLFEHQLVMIRLRFDVIARTVEAEYERRKLEILLRKGRGAEAELRQLEEEKAARLAELEEYYRVVTQANEPAVLRSETRTGLETLARLTYPDLTSAPRPYLTEQEILDLGIPKGSLNDQERREIESHVTHTFRFLMQIPWTKELRRVPLIAYSHHEKLDGTGYPRGVQGAEVPIQARMMTISDIYDALTAADRPYKRAVPLDKALDILKSEAAASHLDSALLDLFIEAQVYTCLAKPA